MRFANRPGLACLINSKIHYNFKDAVVYPMLSYALFITYYTFNTTVIVHSLERTTK